MRLYMHSNANKTVALTWFTKLPNDAKCKQRILGTLTCAVIRKVLM